jgi:pilus assembly protein Flp/PilA
MRLRSMPGAIKWRSVGATRVFRLFADENGVTAIEYTLIAALIGIAAVIFIAEIGSDVAAPFSTIAGRL